MVRYKEGVLVGYRWYDEQAVDAGVPVRPRPSYTTFRFGKPARQAARAARSARSVALDVRNTGPASGTPSPQLYLGSSRSPARRRSSRRASSRRSRGRVVARGAKKRLRFTLNERSFSYWDALANEWRVERGCYPLMIGTSSRVAVRRAMLAVGGARCGKAIAITGKPAKCNRQSKAPRCVRPKARVRKPAG